MPRRPPAGQEGAGRPAGSQLADHPGAGLAEGQFHPFDVATFTRWAADEPAEGEVFARGDDDAIDGGDGEFEVDDFVVLQGKDKLQPYRQVSIFKS